MSKRLHLMMACVALTLTNLVGEAVAQDPPMSQVTEGNRPTWSPNDNRIAFTDGVNSDIWVIQVSGGTATQLTTHPDNDSDPDWGIGDEIVFSREGNLWAVPANGGVERQITDGPEWDGSPAWSPDASQIAFQRDSVEPPNTDIWVIPAAGGTATRLTTNPAHEGAPTWSPDGEQIGFQRFGDIWVMAASGGSETRITVGAIGQEHDWSPNGDYFVFSADLIQLRLVPVTGGVTIPLTNDENPQVDEDREPAWSNDGERIAFRRGTMIWVLEVPVVAVDATSWTGMKQKFR